ncbi:MAG: hypothetical protein EOP33_07755 [Rickettsiaceae bacterium]|nr:MAG: hypothetical protein EOP33_07755 [Rickettsiaceae bacterium]
MKCTIEFREIHETRVSKARSNGTTAGIPNVNSLSSVNSFSAGNSSSDIIPGNINDNLNNAPKEATNAAGSENNTSTESLQFTSDHSYDFANKNTIGSENQSIDDSLKSASVINNIAPSTGSNAVGYDNNDAEIDDSLCIHVAKFDPSISYIDVANRITEKTSLVHKTSFTVFKLHQRRFNKVKPTFVSFKIMAKDKDIFDKIISPDVWGQEFKASPYDRSISKTKAMERRSNRTCRKLIPPQSKANTDSKHGNQKNNHQIKQQPLPLNKPQLLKPQNNQHQKQQQHPNQQPKRQQKPQQQQHPHGRQRGRQQQRIGNQSSLNRLDFGQLNHPNRTKFNGRNSYIVPEYGNIIPSQSANFHPIQGKSHAPPDITMHHLANMLRDVQVQQQQLQQQQQQQQQLLLQLQQQRF